MPRGAWWSISLASAGTTPGGLAQAWNGQVAEWSIAHAWKACVRESVPRVRIPLCPPLRYKTRNADSRRFPSLRGYQRPQKDVFVSFDVDRIVRDLDVLGEGPNVFPPIAALSKPESGACFARQFPHGGTRKALVSGACEHGFDPRSVGPCLIPKRCEARDPLAKSGFGRVEGTRLDSVVKPLEAVVGFGPALVQLGNVLAAPLDAFLPAIQKGSEHVFDPLGVE